MNYQTIKQEVYILLRAVYHLLKGEFSYHAGALTYNFIIVIGSLFSILSILASYTPFLSYERIVSIAVQIFPQHTNEVILTISRFYKGKTTFSLLSFLLAYFFSVSFIKNLYKAFAYVKCDIKQRSEISFWVFLPILTFIFSLLSIAIITAYALLKFFIVKIPFTFLANLLFLLIVLFAVYKYFINASTAKTFYVSLLISIFLYFFNKLFVSLLVKFVTLNPLYGLVGSFLIFLVWLYLSFQLVLVGAKIFTYKERD